MKTETTKKKLTKAEEKKLVELAKDYIPELRPRKDLEPHNSDREDFFETSVWSLKAALEAAYRLGRESNR